MEGYLPFLGVLLALLAGLAIGKAWERYKLRDGRWIDRRRLRETPHYMLGLNFLADQQVDLARGGELWPFYIVGAGAVLAAFAIGWYMEAAAIAFFMILSVGYVATRSVNQLVRFEQNWGPIGEGNAGRVLNQRFGRTAGALNHGSLGTPKYDSLQAKLDRRYSNGIQLGFGYTWGHARAFTSEDSGAGTNRFAIPEFYHRMYGRANQDIRHNFQMTGIYETPFGRGKRWATSASAAPSSGRTA